MLGLTGYSHKFIPGYADLVKPLMQLACKIVPLILTNQCQEALETLKDAFMKSPILGYQDPKKPYALFMDASEFAWSAVLTQEHTIFLMVRQ